MTIRQMKRTYFVIMMAILWSAVNSEAGYQITFTPRVSVNTDYSDNLFLQSENEAYDYITVISPGFTAQAMNRTWNVTLSYDMGYSCYEKFVQYNTLRHNAQLTGGIGFTKHTRLDFKNTFLLTEEDVTKVEEAGSETEESPLTEPKTHVAEKETVRRTREQHYSDDMLVVLTHQFGEADIFNAKYSYNILKNEDTAVQDTTRHNPSLSFVYWPLPGQFGVNASLSYKREERSDTAEQAGYWEESVIPSVGVKYWFIPRQLGIEADIFYTKEDFLDISDGRNKWDKSLKPSIRLIFKPASGRLGFESSLVNTGALASDPTRDFDNWQGSMKISRQLTKQLEGFFQYTHTVMDFKGNGENYSVYDPSVGITYTFAEGLPLTFSLGYFIRNKAQSEDDAALALNGNLGKTWNFNRHGSVSLTTSSGYDEDYIGAERLGFGIYYDAKSTAKYAFSKYLSADLYGSFRRDKYTDLETTRNDETRELGSGLTFRKNPWVIRVDYTRRTIDSTLSENDYDENRITLKVVLSPFRPIRLND